MRSTLNTEEKSKAPFATKLKTKFPEDFSVEWENVRTGRYSTSQGTDQVRIRASSKNEKNDSVTLFVSIGKEIADLMGITNKDRVTCFRNKITERHFIIRKSEMTYSYKICQPAGARTANFSFVILDKNKKIKKDQSIIIDFDIQDDGALMLDISNIIQK